MIHRILDLAYSSARGRIDDEPLQRLLHGHEVVRLREWLYVQDGIPHLVVSVLYRLAALGPSRSIPASSQPHATSTAESRDPGARPQAPAGPPEGSRDDGDWRSILSEENSKLFETLRAWRTARACSDAVPPYVLLTNVQLAHVANKRPRTLEALREVPGLGESRIGRFGRDVLAVVSSGVVAHGAPAKESSPGHKTAGSGDGGSAVGPGDDAVGSGSFDAPKPLGSGEAPAAAGPGSGVACAGKEGP